MSHAKLNSTEEQAHNFTDIYMGEMASILINGPLCIVNLVVNIFFVFCIFTPNKMQQVRQPLKSLICFMVFSAILYFIAGVGLYILSTYGHFIEAYWTFFSLTLLTVYVNMTSYVWLMFYYYIMIVPSQRALHFWVKKNIKCVIYALLFVDRSIFLINVLLRMVDRYMGGSSDRGTNSVYQWDNGTWVNFFIRAYTLFCLCLMMFSSFSMAHYLNNHVKRLVANGGSHLNLALRSQIRVTATGIFQGVLCFLYSVWQTVSIVFYYVPPYLYFDPHIQYTVISLYISGTTANLGVGQTLFRDRAMHVWKAVKKQLCTGKTSKNLRAPENQMTIGNH